MAAALNAHLVITIPPALVFATASMALAAKALLGLAFARVRPGLDGLAVIAILA